MLLVYKCANEQEGENRSLNGPKGGRGQKHGR